MTKEEIIEMACQAFGGVIKKEERDNFINFAKLVAEHEREACAKIIDDSYTTTKASEGIPEDWLLTLSELIRARGQAWDDCLHIYTTPKRKPLTDEEIRKFQHHMVSGAYQYSFMQGVRYAEAVHGIKE